MRGERCGEETKHDEWLHQNLFNETGTKGGRGRYKSSELSSKLPYLYQMWSSLQFTDNLLKQEAQEVITRWDVQVPDQKDGGERQETEGGE